MLKGPEARLREPGMGLSSSDGGCERDLEGEAEYRPSLCPNCRKNGRQVARLPAVMASPCSTVDQIAMSVVASAWVSY